MTVIDQKTGKVSFPRKCPKCDGRVLYNIEKALCISCGWKKNLLEE
jgi:ribosomal protein L37E